MLLPVGVYTFEDRDRRFARAPRRHTLKCRAADVDRRRSRFFSRSRCAATLLFPDGLNALLLDRKALLLIAEIGLVMTLFTDASRISLKLLAGNRNLTVRLFSTGMILTIIFGGVAAMTLFSGQSVWEADIIAAILAPTDAGLGAVIVSSPKVPTRVRNQT